ncbi:Meckel syndrome type 1 protein homolog [Teleopsis dalmanni]|uniref:Meckel syndrome type 1 protein homolog n=1 Tax=Teleopsis dalmanni TaxID=139649 RepID=UPI0018CF59DD|nr:Meckel syndrome type 1 protein homolog [Teleopsis dalmanni]
MYHKSYKHSGTYHIKDSIEHLELRLHFWHVNSLLKLPKLEINKNYNLNKQSSTNEFLISDKENEKIINIKWQEKILSRREIELYKNINNCKNETTTKYNELIKRTSLVSDDELGCESIKKHKSKRQGKKIQERKQRSIRNEAIEKKHQIFTYVQADNFDQSEEHKRKGSIKSTLGDSAMETMYIFASLDPDIQLLVLKWNDQERLLHVYPDFNNFEGTPHIIEINTDYRHLYAFSCKNISKCRQIKYIPPSIYLPEIDMDWHRKTTLAEQFSMPPKHSKRVMLLLDIQNAKGFEYNNLHVRYYIRLPPNTSLEGNSNILSGSTHSSSSSRLFAGEYHFGVSLQLTLLCDETFTPTNLLHIYFEVISIDWLERERVEGYTHYATYLSPGLDALQLQCQRPAEITWLDTFNRYFIGGRQKFEFVKYFTETQSEFHCRYRCKMLSTGTLSFCCQRITQRNCELLEPCINRACGMTLDDVMHAYREARKRLEAVA